MIIKGINKKKDLFYCKLKVLQSHYLTTESKILGLSLTFPKLKILCERELSELRVKLYLILNF